MKKTILFITFFFVFQVLLSEPVDYAYPRPDYLKELTRPSKTLRDDAPEIIASGNVNYTIGSPPVIVAPNITLSNFTEDIEGMKIYFTNNFIISQDVLELSTGFPGVTENYDQSTGILILEGTGSASFWQDVCRHVQYRNSSSSPTQEVKDVTFTIISAIFIPSTGHYYEFVSDYGIAWSDSKANADSASYYGLQGYLATITSPVENFFITTELGGVGWIGGSDAEDHNHWKWICGPEEGTEFWEGLYTGHPTIPGFPVNNMYANWNYHEPNQYFGDDDPDMWEDYLHMIYNPSVGPVGSWNDLPDAGTTGNFTPYGYVVEYGGMPGDPELNLYGTVQVTVTDLQVTEILPSAGGDITINETESISFSINAYDPDGNPLEYSWKLDGVEVSTTDSYDFTTDYSSAGSYEIILHVSNGTGSELNYVWNITVIDIDQNIIVNDIQPTPGNVTINEAETINFFIDAYDPDGDPLEYSWKLYGTEVSTTSNYDFTTDYTSAGIYVVTLDVTDNFVADNMLSYLWNVTVLDVDQPIVVNDIQPPPGNVTINELETINFFIDAYDPDGNPLEYSWELDGTEVSTTDSYDFTTDYNSAGTYVVTLDVTDNYVSDNTINYIWNVTVLDVDRPIVVTDIQPPPGSITINEMESISFSIDAYDPDGNPLEYSWKLDGTEVSTTDSYDFTTDYNSAGTYIVTLDVTDNFVSDNILAYLWDVTVLDVDQPIVVNDIQPAPGNVTINELETINFFIDAYDPDGNPLEYSWKLDGVEVSITDSYDFTTDYNSAGTYVVTLDVTDNFVSDNILSYLWDVTVLDVDQPIVVNNIQPAPGNVTINEAETINFFIDAYDPDGNPLEYSWKLDGVEVSTTDFYDFLTDYTSAGIYVVTLDVTDNFVADNTLSYLWNVTVIDIDQPIVVNNIQPAPGNVTINEAETINFFIDAYDPDGNPLEYSWKLDGTEVSTTDSYDFTTDYNSAGTYIVTLDVTDNFVSDNILAYLWDVTVLDVDQPIVVNDIQPAPGNVTINELESINFFIDAYDPDGNPLEYSWKLDGTEVSTTDSYDFLTDYTSAGTYVVTLDVTDNFVSDNTLTYLWDVTVIDIDQPIVVNAILPAPGSITIDELESISFSIDAYDPDGNPLEYSWKLDGVEVSIVDYYVYISDYNSAGLHIVELDVTDNFVSDNTLTFQWDITVNDVDQPIVVNTIQPAAGNVTINEMETINFFIDAYDPDGNPLEYSWKVDETEVSTVSSYDFTTDYTSAGIYVITLNVTDNFVADNTLSYLWDVEVLDVDQPIVVNNIIPDPGNLVIIEGETINFSIDAYDPDGNLLEYSWELDGSVVSNISTYDFVTNMNSAGYYVLTLFVTDNYSDSILEFTWFITVLDSSANIVVTSIVPAPGLVTLYELEEINFVIDAYTMNGDDLFYNWELDGNEVSITNSYLFTTDYNSAGEYELTLEVSDTLLVDTILNFTWDISVLESDQAIVVNEILPAPGNLTIDENDIINFSIDAYDPDGNPLEYSWKVDEEELSILSTFDFITDFTSAGEYLITLDVTDNFSDNALYYEWNITVNDVDQPIVVESIQPTPGEVSFNEGETLNFIIDAYDPDGNLLEYSWKLDGTEVSTVSSYDFTTDYTSAGTYVVTLDVTDNFGTDNTLSFLWDVEVLDVDQTIVVNEIVPEPGNYVISEGDSISFYIDAYDPDGNPLEYNWELDGVTVSTEDNYEFITNMNSAGTYDISLFVTDNYSDCILEFDWFITVLDGGINIVVNNINPAPGMLEIYETEEIPFFIDAYAVNGVELNYIWALDGNVVSNTDSYLFTTDYTSAGEYVLTLQVSDTPPTDTTLNFIWEITVLDTDQPIVINELIPEPGLLIIMEMETIDFMIDAYDPDGNPLEYSWKLDDEEVSTENTYEFLTNYNSAGNYMICLDVTDNFGTDNTLHFEWSVIVSNINPNIIINEIDPFPGNVSCYETESIDFIIDAINPNGEVYLSWQLDGLEVSTESFYEFITDYTSAGNYELILIVSSDPISRDYMHFDWDITVHNVNLAPTANAGVDQYVYSGDLVQLDGSESSDPDGDELNYHWIAPEEIVLSDTTIVNPTFIAPNVIGEVPFTIILIVDDGDLSSEPDEVVITVNGNVNTDETITPLTTTLLGNYPNPFNPTTTIRFDVQENETATLTIFNVRGQIVEQKIFSAGVHNHEWNAADISSGVYFYRLKSQSYSRIQKMILLK